MNQYLQFNTFIKKYKDFIIGKIKNDGREFAWVSDEANHVRKKYEKNLILISKRKQIYEYLKKPSFNNFIILLFLFFILGFGLDYFLACIGVDFVAISKENLLAFYSIAAFVAFALVVLIAETSLHKNKNDSARVLSDKISLFPSVVFILIQPLFVLLFYGDFYEVIAPYFLIICLLVIINMSIQVFSFVLDKYYIEKATYQLFMRQVMTGIGETISSKIGRKIFLDYSSKFMITYDPYFLSEYKKSVKAGYGSFVSLNYNFDSRSLSRPVRITDVNIKKFDLLLDRIEGLLNKKHYSINVNDNNKIKYKHIEDGFILLKGFDDRVYLGSLEVVYINKEIEDILGVKDINYIKKQLNQIYKIELESDFLEIEFSVIQSAFVNSIKDSDIAKVKQYRDIHIDIIDSIMKVVGKYEAYQSFNDAYKERGDAFNSLFRTKWKEIEYIEKSIDIGIEEAFKNNSVIIPEVIRIAQRSISRSIVYKNQLIFQVMLNKIVDIFDLLCSSVLDLRVKNSIRDELLLYIDNILDYYIIEGQLKENSNLQNTQIYSGFSDYVMIIFKNLLVVSYNKKDKDSFEEIYNKIFYSFKYLENDVRGGYYTISNEEDRLKNKILKKTVDRKYEALFGFFAWTFWHIKDAKKEQEDMILDLLKDIRKLEQFDVVKIIQLCINCKVFPPKKPDLFGWDEMFEPKEASRNKEPFAVITNDAFYLALVLLIMYKNYDVDEVAQQIFDEGVEGNLSEPDIEQVYQNEIFIFIKNNKKLGKDVDYEKALSNFKELIERVL